MARKKKPGPTWDQLTDEQKGRLDKLFRLLLVIAQRRGKRPDHQAPYLPAESQQNSDSNIKNLNDKQRLCYNSDMVQYVVQPYKQDRWVILESCSGREIILFNDKEQAEKACRILNGDGEG